MADAISQATKPVLVVDDQSTARTILREILLSLGYQVVEAATAEAAIEYIANQSFCLVTLDIILPQSSGLEVLRFARSRHDYSELPVIVVSVKDQSADIVEALTLGANDYVTKPINHEVLTARIRTHLSQWHSERELRRAREDLETRVAARTVDLELANRALRTEIEERRNAEQVLRKYEQMINSASDMLTFMDTAYRYVAVNRTFLQTLGLARDDVVDKNMQDLFGKQFFDAELKPKVDLSLNGATVAAQLEIDLPARGRRHVDLRFDPHRGEDGKVTGAVVIARDVTEKQQAENALHALAITTAHKDTQAFFETCILSLVKTYAAEYAYVSVFGESEDQLQTLAIWNRDRFAENFSYDVRDTPCADVLRNKSLFVERNVTDSYPGFETFQNWQIESYFGHMMQSQEGKPLGLVAVAHSKPIKVNAWTRSILETFAGRIALELERSRALQASERSLSLHRATLESTGSGILVVDNKHRILSFNQQFLAMWNITQDHIATFMDNHRDALGFMAEQLINPQAFMESAGDPDRQVNGTSRDLLYFKDGRIFERQTKPYSLAGNTVGQVVNFLDITERVHAEQQLEDYRNNLEELVSSRTAELEAVNNEIASFSYSVSHDLRAPLRSIDGFSKLMLEDYGNKLDDNARVYLTRIRNASQRMGELIDDVLLLSRLSRRELSFQELNLARIAEEIFRKLDDSEPHRSAELVVPQQLPAKGDPHLLRILLENLLGNAWKYSRKQNSVRIELNAQHDDNGQLIYFVRDNGVGFDMKYVEKLFQPFQRLHSVTEFEGTGIGLATVAQIVRRHSGEVWAESELYSGATFYFTLTSRHASN
jgi:PAS domain S-box-containing protein